MPEPRAQELPSTGEGAGLAGPRTAGIARERRAQRARPEKEAAGDLTDDEGLKAEGKTDKAGGKIKQGLEDAKDKAEDVVDKVKDKIQRDR